MAAREFGIIREDLAVFLAAAGVVFTLLIAAKDAEQNKNDPNAQNPSSLDEHLFHQLGPATTYSYEKTTSASYPQNYSTY